MRDGSVCIREKGLSIIVSFSVWDHWVLNSILTCETICPFLFPCASFIYRKKSIRVWVNVIEIKALSHALQSFPYHSIVYTVNFPLTHLNGLEIQQQLPWHCLISLHQLTAIHILNIWVSQSVLGHANILLRYFILCWAFIHIIGWLFTASIFI